MPGASHAVVWRGYGTVEKIPCRQRTVSTTIGLRSSTLGRDARSTTRVSLSGGSSFRSGRYPAQTPFPRRRRGRRRRGCSRRDARRGRRCCARLRQARRRRGATRPAAARASVARRSTALPAAASQHAGLRLVELAVDALAAEHLGARNAVGAEPGRSASVVPIAVADGRCVNAADGRSRRSSPEIQGFRSAARDREIWVAPTP
jgi:hypothetical protein